MSGSGGARVQRQDYHAQLLRRQSTTAVGVAINPWHPPQDEEATAAAGLTGCDSDDDQHAPLPAKVVSTAASLGIAMPEGASALVHPSVKRERWRAMRAASDLVEDLAIAAAAEGSSRDPRSKAFAPHMSARRTAVRAEIREAVNGSRAALALRERDVRQSGTIPAVADALASLDSIVLPYFLRQPSVACFDAPVDPSKPATDNLARKAEDRLADAYSTSLGWDKRLASGNALPSQALDALEALYVADDGEVFGAEAEACPPAQEPAAASPADIDPPPLPPSPGLGSFAHVNAIKLNFSQTSSYRIAFNTLNPRLFDVFAVLLGTGVAVLQCCANGSMRLLQLYDESSARTLYSLAWLHEPATGHALLAVGAADGVIRVMDTTTQKVVHTLRGHGGAVHELRVHPLDDCLLFSASEDHSARLWNVQTERTVAIFGGDGGHVSEMLTLDIHPDGTEMATGSMDRSVRVWQLNTVRLLRAMEASYKAEDPSRPWKAVFVSHPAFWSFRIHTNYVDSLRYVGDTLCTKSVESTIVRWTPLALSDPKTGDMFYEVFNDTALVSHGGFVDVLAAMRYTGGDLWYTPMDLSASARFLAVGTSQSQVFVFDVDAEPDFSSGTASVTPLYTLNCNAPGLDTEASGFGTIRAVSFSAHPPSEGPLLVAVADDGVIHLFNSAAVEPKPPSAATSAR
ncbi:polycomb protein eed [Thecamonas trahens ATCC 50062]|uniref:Polycomb protein eed n=1 Tax=Thecamonas trahens ATCC 50062 TaxID=461836 RepID=A0A0L0DW96_THETB|nr:polycomb protein eed [Thecamonas trahens ATCC 50062]KNC56452.1 polycomb protein eed [Thecamonas trahens ATCC 50062]|eukprot:XP_013760964.1 polycomb protein eed [Thecamonas trahens ATCC 50062]